MNELDDLRLQLKQLESANRSLKEQLAQISSPKIVHDHSGELVSELAKNLVENLQAGIVVHDADTKVIFANPAAARILGIIHSEMDGKDVNDPDWHFFHGDGSLMSLEDFPVNVVMRKKQPLYNYEMGLYVSATQETVWAVINAYPEFDQQGEIIQTVVTFVEISDRKKAEQEIEHTRNFLQTIIDHLPVALFVKDGRAEHFGKTLLWNHTCETMFGFTVEQSIGKTVYDHVPKEQADFFHQKDQEAFLKGTPENISEEPIDTPNLGRRILHTVKVPLYDRDRNPQYLLCFSEDITDRKQVEKALKESEEKFRQMAENIHEVFWMIDPDFTRFIYINPAYEKISGYSCESVYKNPQSFMAVIHEEDRDMVIARFRQNPQIGWVLEYRIVQPNGTVRWLFEHAVPVHNAEGEVKSIVGIGQDVTERKHSEEKLIHQAFHDSLTKLPNRILFTQRLEMALERAKCIEENSFAVLFVDLDRFKVINDSLGHLIGDRLLIAIAEILKKSVRSFDTVARLGGDEFTILLDDIQDSQDAIEVAERIHAHLQDEIVIDGNKILISASIGIVYGCHDYDCAVDLLRDADIAMYQAKDQGRACYKIFDRSMYDLFLSHLQLENELRQALIQEEFLVYYEPIVCLKTMDLCGFEALVRWQHPTRGLITAGEFIPIAEETGLIVALGEWVLQTVCHQIKSWLENFPLSKCLTINVNLSCKQLKDPNIVQIIDDILQEIEIPSTSLNLEITETLLIENTEIAISVFKNLRERDIHLSLDDFGTGYSSLSYLQRFPVNTIKIDRSFISQMCLDDLNGDRNFEIVKAIIALAHAMNIKVIAEGIELKEQIDQLKKWNCDFAQGYFFSRSLTAQAASNLLENLAQSAPLF